MNYVENDSGAMVIAVGAPGSDARMKATQTTPPDAHDSRCGFAASYEEAVALIIERGYRW